MLRALADRLIPTGTSTASKRWLGGAPELPQFVDLATGCRVRDVFGRQFIDMSMALGTTILGYAEPCVIDAVCAAVTRTGGITSACDRREGEIMAHLQSYVPLIGKGAFLLNGSDAVNAAVRLARRATGRSTVLVCGSYGPFGDAAYHGWSDWLSATEGSRRGVPLAWGESLDWFVFNELDSLDRALEKAPNSVAAIVLEGLKFDPPNPGFLAGVRERARVAGAVLVFDEIVHGLRLAWGGAHQHYGVEPDLVCLGKAFGSGFPIAIVGGRPELLDLVPEIRLSLTFAAAPYVLAAVEATMACVAENAVLERVRIEGEAFQSNLRRAVLDLGLSSRVVISGYGSRFILRLLDRNGLPSSRLTAVFAHGCARQGVLVADVHNVCLAHCREDLAVVAGVYRSVLQSLPWD